MDRHNHDVSYLSQDRTRSKVRSRASHGNYRRTRDHAATVADLVVRSLEPKIGHLPLIGRSRKALTDSSMSLHKFETWLFECRTRPSLGPSRRRAGSRRFRSKLPG